MSHDGKGLSALYARDTSSSKEGERKRSRFDEGAPEEDSDRRRSSNNNSNNNSHSHSHSHSHSSHRHESVGESYKRHREDYESDRKSESVRYRDDRRSDNYQRHRDRETKDDGSKSYKRDEREVGSRSDYHERERSRDRDRDGYKERDRYRERDYSRNDKRESSGYSSGYNSSRDHYRDSRDNYRRPQHSSSVEIPFDKFLRLSPWRGPVVALEERVRHLKNWDVAPAGFERIGADKAKLTGLFPPPGNIAKSANYVPPTLDPARAAMLQLLNKDNINMRDTTTTSSDFSNGNTSSSIPANLQKQAKRFYVGNLPVSISESALMAFLESNLASLSGTTRNQVAPISQENRVMSINISTDRSYAFVDCRTAEDASLAMNLDGVLLESSQLKIRRPKEYHVAITSGLISNASNNNNSSSNDKSASSFADATDSSTSTTCCINRRQLVISGIPDILTGEHIRSLLLLVAELRSFLLLRDRKTDKSLGVAIFEFIEDSPEVENWTAPFLKHTKGRIFMGPFEMKLARVIDLIDDAEELEITSQEQELEDSSSSAVFDEKEKIHLQSLLSLYNLQPGYATAPSSTPVLQILNIVTPQTLQSDYEAIRSDLTDELKKFCHGEEEKFELTIPQYAEPGAGKVYVKYAKIEEAARAAREISGRIFDGHTCIVSFYPPEKLVMALHLLAMGKPNSCSNRPENSKNKKGSSAGGTGRRVTKRKTEERSNLNSKNSKNNASRNNSSNSINRSISSGSSNSINSQLSSGSSNSHISSRTISNSSSAGSSGSSSSSTIRNVSSGSGSGSIITIRRSSSSSTSIVTSRLPISSEFIDLLAAMASHDSTVRLSGFEGLLAGRIDLTELDPVNVRELLDTLMNEVSKNSSFDSSSIPGNLQVRLVAMRALCLIPMSQDHSKVVISLLRTASNDFSVLIRCEALRTLDKLMSVTVNQLQMQMTNYHGYYYDDGFDILKKIPLESLTLAEVIFAVLSYVAANDTHREARLLAMDLLARIPGHLRLEILAQSVKKDQFKTLSASPKTTNNNTKNNKSKKNKKQQQVVDCETQQQSVLFPLLCCGALVHGIEDQFVQVRLKTLAAVYANLNRILRGNDALLMDNQKKRNRGDAFENQKKRQKKEIEDGEVSSHDDEDVRVASELNVFKTSDIIRLFINVFLDALLDECDLIRLAALKYLNHHQLPSFNVQNGLESILAVLDDQNLGIRLMALTVLGENVLIDFSATSSLAFESLLRTQKCLERALQKYPQMEFPVLQAAFKLITPNCNEILIGACPELLVHLLHCEDPKFMLIDGSNSGNPSVVHLMLQVPFLPIDQGRIQYNKLISRIDDGVVDEKRFDLLYDNDAFKEHSIQTDKCSIDVDKCSIQTDKDMDNVHINNNNLFQLLVSKHDNLDALFEAQKRKLSSLPGHFFLHQNFPVAYLRIDACRVVKGRRLVVLVEDYKLIGEHSSVNLGLCCNGIVFGDKFIPRFDPERERYIFRFELNKCDECEGALTIVDGEDCKSIIYPIDSLSNKTK